MPRAAAPRGMIDTRCTGSAFFTESATSAWPISWKATISRSLSLMTRLLRSSPATTRSMASSSSDIPTASFSRRAASRAASLTTLARSAPVKPGVREAITRRSTSSPRATPRAWTWRMASRPLRSGRSTTTWRSNRPGRSSAGSRTSGRFVAAMMITPFDASNPSISTSSWFSVCSRSSCEPRPAPMAPPRVLPIVSSSSRKTRQGARSLACWNSSRTRAAPRPTNISTNSEPDMKKNGTLASPATARARRVFPHPGGPNRRTPLGNRPAEPLILLRVLQERHDLPKLLDRLVDAGHVGEGCLEVLAVVDLHAALAQVEGAGRTAPGHASEHESPDRHQHEDREDPGEQEVGERRGLLAGEPDPVLPKHRLQLSIFDARDPGGHESRPIVATFPPGDLGLGDRHLLDPALLDQVQERRVLDLLGLRNQGALDHEQQDDAQEDVAEREPPPAAVAAPGAEVEPLPASLTPVVVGHFFLPPQRGGAPPCSHIAAVSWPP